MAPPQTAQEPVSPGDGGARSPSTSAKRMRFSLRAKACASAQARWLLFASWSAAQRSRCWGCSFSLRRLGLMRRRLFRPKPAPFFRCASPIEFNPQSASSALRSIAMRHGSSAVRWGNAAACSSSVSGREHFRRQPRAARCPPMSAPVQLGQALRQPRSWHRRTHPIASIECLSRRARSGCLCWHGTNRLGPETREAPFHFRG